MPLQFSTNLVAGPESLDWDFMHIFDVRTRRSGLATELITARLVDGRDADLVTLGKIAQAVIPAVRKLAATNQALFLEAQRRQLNNEIRALEQEIEKNRAKIAEKEKELAKIADRLP